MSFGPRRGPQPPPQQIRLAAWHHPRHPPQPPLTGHEVWNKQRKEERLIDVDEVTLGHQTRMAHNPQDKWIWSNDPAHESIITTRLFEDAQKVRRERSLEHGGRPERDTAVGKHPYPARQHPLRPLREKNAARHHP